MQDVLFALGKQQILQRISITKLFGRYTYSISLSKPPIPNLTILYGRNGSGKTTLLRLVFDLLYPDAGRKKFGLAYTPFSEMSVSLSNNVVLQVKRDNDKLLGPFTIDLFEDDRHLDHLSFRPGTVQQRARPGNFQASDEDEAAQMHTYTRRLKSYEYSLAFLNSYRLLETTDPTITRNEQRQRREMLPAFDEDDLGQRLTRLPIEPSMESAWRRIQLLGRIQANDADWQANDRFADIVRRVASRRVATKQDTNERDTAIARLSEQATKSQLYAAVGLAKEFNPEPIISSINSATPDRLDVVLALVTTYLESQDARLHTIDRLYETVVQFTNSLNAFYEGGKTVSFHMNDGIKITAGGEPLNPASLSSGEQHLMLLFCNKLSFANRTGVVLIDEPELSLNVEWQRLLLSYLLKGHADESVQYIVATHSFEMLAQYEASVAELSVNDHAAS